MAGDTASDAKRPHVVGVRLTNGEIEALDRLRGPLRRSEYLRLLLTEARRKV